MTTKELRSLVSKLRKNFPVVGKVVVLRRRRKKCSGKTNIEVKYSAWTFRIYIDSLQDKGSQIDALLHEWAHIIAIQEACDHQGRWATAYGEIYTAWECGFSSKDNSAS